MVTIQVNAAGGLHLRAVRVPVTERQAHPVFKAMNESYDAGKLAGQPPSSTTAWTTSANPAGADFLA